MANNTSTVARVCILLTIISTLFMSFSQARIVHGEKVMQKNIDSKQLLQELGFDLSKLENFQRRSLGDPYDQVVPGGPDHQHHV
jgi:hypothetical protein